MILPLDYAVRVVAAVRAIERVAECDEVSVDAWAMGCAATEAVLQRTMTDGEASLALAILGATP